MRSRKLTIVITFSLLIVAPLIFDRIVSNKQQRQDARDDELVKAYECYPLNACVMDFNGDGIPARLEVAMTYAVGGDLIVSDGGKEVLRLPYDHTDNTFRTHIAFHGEKDNARLLVYDGVPPGAAYEWNGDKLVEVTPIGVEEEILSAMAAHDEKGGWIERTVYRPIKRLLYLGAYYIVLVAAVAVMLFRRFRRPLGGTANETGTISGQPAI